MKRWRSYANWKKEKWETKAENQKKREMLSIHTLALSACALDYMSTLLAPNSLPTIKR